MKKPGNKKNIRKVFLFIFFICVCLSCKRTVVTKITNLSEFADYQKKCIDTNLIKINIDTIDLWETDKRRNGLRISPDEIEIDLTLSITNKSDKNIKLQIREGQDINSSCIYGYIMSDNIDSIIFINSNAMIPDSIIIHRKTMFHESFGSVLYRNHKRYRFERLFGTKDDYTKDMINLVNRMYFKCRIHSDSSILIGFSPNNKTLLFRKNTK